MIYTWLVCLVMSTHFSYWKGISLVTDTGWGDSGKGKIVDVGAQAADMVIRYNGGPNAGHTVHNSKGEFKLHLVSSGIFNPKALCLLAPTVFVDPIYLTQEIQSLRKQNISISSKNFMVANSAHMIMPWHQLQDTLSEAMRKKGKIGTTGRGIGPTARDRASRTGLVVGDLLKNDLKKRFDEEFVQQERLARLLADEMFISDLNAKKYAAYDKKRILNLAKEANKNLSLSKTKIWSDLLEARSVLRSLIGNTLEAIWKYRDDGKTILGEGAQGALLDLDLGGYPYVTSSNPGFAGFAKATGIHTVNNVIGVLKAYSTRVGEGPMVTELLDKTGKFLQEKGHEIGVTTGRVRRCGWLDVPAMKYGAMITGVTSLAMTKLDVLDELDEVKICTGYKVAGKTVKRLTTFDPEVIKTATPIYESLSGWQKDTTKVRVFSDLPKKARAYVERVATLMDIPVEIVSVGPMRSATIYL